MKKLCNLFIAVFFIAIMGYGQQYNVLVFTKASAYRHSVTPTAIDAIWDMSQKHHFEIKVTDRSNDFNIDNLSKFQVVLFLNCSGDVLNESQQEALKKYMRNGGGFVGIHGATTAEKEWVWYGQLIGRYFTAHPKKQSAVIHVKDPDFPATYHLPDKWLWTDEWYEFTEAYSDSLHVLLTVDENTYNHIFERNGKSFTGMQPEHPIAWYQFFEEGRMFYTSLGHFEKAWKDPYFLQHVYGGIWWAATKQ